MDPAVVFLSSGIGAMIAGDEHDLAVGDILGHLECVFLLGLAEHIGGLLVVIAEILALVLGRLYHNGDKDILIGQGSRSVSLEPERSGKHILAVGAAFHLLVGSVRYAEKLEFHPDVELLPEPRVAEYSGDVVDLVCVGNLAGFDILVHEGSDESSQLDALHFGGRVCRAALGHEGEIDVADTVVVVTHGAYHHAHVEVFADLCELFVTELHGIKRCEMAQYAVIVGNHGLRLFVEVLQFVVSVEKYHVIVYMDHISEHISGRGAGCRCKSGSKHRDGKD